MKVGDYARTNNGDIGILTKVFNEGEFIIDTYPDEVRYDCIKSSPNIIDLIEVGDIVNYEQLNGGVVLNKKDDSIDTWSILPNSLKNEDIKSVITKEQLKNCMYEVGE